MKKNLFSLSILAIALTTGSCINDLDEGQTPGANNNGQAITLKAWANKQTRAGATQAADITDFAVLATDTSLSTGVGVLINGALVTGGGSNWTYSPPAFWPETAAVNFFAFSPTAAPGVTDNATIDTVGYQTFWVPDSPTTPTVVDLEANLTTDTVTGDGAWHYIVGDDDALYVIPQENDPSDLTGATKDGTSSLFYIEITYQEVGAGAVPKTYAVPVPAIVGDAYISSIAFEMERQYTFRFELFGNKPIEFQGVTVSPYSEVEQEEPLRLQWAGSNIYYSTSLKHLTFDDSNVKTNEQYQGVYFQWGSLTGISPVGTYVQGSTLIYPKAGESVANALAWTDLPHPATDPVGTVYDRDSKHLTEVVHDTVAGVGYICKYLTELGYAPKGKRWRMPTSKEFGDATSDYANGSGSSASWTAVSSVNTAGTDLFANGKQLQKSNAPFFPASGYRYYSSGALVAVGTYAGYWSSSPAGANFGSNLNFDSTAAYPANYSIRLCGFPVRCVTE